MIRAWRQGAAHGTTHGTGRHRTIGRAAANPAAANPAAANPAACAATAGPAVAGTAPRLSGLVRERRADAGRRRAGRWLALAAAAGLLAACAGVGADPVAETEPRGGIGGTGITTGVLGTVTGFGSVHVNGLIVGTADRLAESPLGPVALETGHVVELLAEPATADAPAGTGLTARRVAVAWPLVGPITAVGDNRLAVMGVPVKLEPGAPVPGPEALLPGRRVAVSGLWRDGAVVASRLDPAPAGLDLAAGVVAHAAAPAGPAPGQAAAGEEATADQTTAERTTGEPAIGSPSPALSPGLSPALSSDGSPPGSPAGSPSVRIGRLPLADAADLAAGAHWRLRGRWDGARFVVETAEPGRPLLRAGPLARLSVEGYLTAGPGGRARIDGLGVAFDDGARVDPLTRERAVFIGRLDGRFHVEHGIPLPEGAAARAEALQAIGNGLAPTRGTIETR